MAKPKVSRKLPQNWKNMSIDEQVEYVEISSYPRKKANPARDHCGERLYLDEQQIL